MSTRAIIIKLLGVVVVGTAAGFLTYLGLSAAGVPEVPALIVDGIVGFAIGFFGSALVLDDSL